MSKKLILFFIAVVFFSKFNLVFADVVINEIMYSPASKQWIEVYNNTDSDIDITQYKIKDAGVVNGHNITPISGGLNIIPAHAYGIIAKDVTSVNATYLFHSSLGISTTASDTVILKNNDSSIDTVQVSLNSALDGNSLQLINGSWIAAIPTPGAVNQAGTTAAISSGSGLVSGGPSDTPNITTATSTKTKIVEESKIKTQIIGKTFGFVGIPISLQGTAFGLSGEQLHFGKYFWNFGDGDSKEMDLIDASQPLYHSYFYPGDYVVSLDYFQNHYSNVPDASSQITVKIIPADILISSVGDERDFFVELANNTDYNADLSNWILGSVAKGFTIPHNTILSARKKIIISPKITGFSIADKNTLKLMNGEGKVMFDYGASNSPLEEYPEVLPQGEVDNASTPSPVKVGATPEEGNNSAENSGTKIPAENLEASAISSDIASNDNPNNSRTAIILIISVIFVGASAYGVYIIRQKRVVPQSGGDFEVLDE